MDRSSFRASWSERDRRHLVAWLAVATLLAVLGIAISLTEGRGRARAETQRSRLAFSSSSAELAGALRLALQHEEDLVVAAAAFLADNPDATQAELAYWGQSVRAFQRYPELLGLGLSTLVRDSELRAFEARLRAERPDAVDRYGRLAIVPSGRRPFYCLLRAGFTRIALAAVPQGTDYCATNRHVVDSIESGRGTYLPLDLGIAQVLTVEMPVYRTGIVPRTAAERRRSFVGWVGNGIVPSVVLASALVGHPNTSVTLAYRAQGQQASFTAGSAPTRSQHRLIKLGDGWSMTAVGPLHAHGVLEGANERVIVLGGSAGSIVFALLVFVLGTGRSRALRLVAERTRQLGHQALHDGLTGLPNRSLVLDRAGQLLARNRRRPGGVAVAMFVDVDGFKHINDTHGHAAGDHVLKEIAQRLAAGVREQDTVGRVGGDEFIVLLDSRAAEDHPAEVAERLIEAVRAPIDLPDGSTTLSTSASIGIAVGQRDTADDLLRDADLALYEAKTLGKDRFVLFKPRMHAAVKDRLALEADLAHALANDEFYLVYQPTFDLRNRTVLGVEALIRWRHPTRGVVAPADFISLAEETGHILPIGRWTLHEACRQAAEWRSAGFDLGMAVNVSAYQLDRNGLFEDVKRALEESALPPRALTLEITESALMHDVGAAARRLAELKSLGVRIAIDDFGTGYSSLSYLRQFPVDALKIDRSFITAIAASDEAIAIIHTLVQLGKTLRLETLAEGIEERGQLEQLQREHCDHGQGFLFAKPLEAAAIPGFLTGATGSEGPARAA